MHVHGSVYIVHAGREHSELIISQSTNQIWPSEMLIISQSTNQIRPSEMPSEMPWSTNYSISTSSSVSTSPDPPLLFLFSLLFSYGRVARRSGDETRLVDVARGSGDETRLVSRYFGLE